MWDMSLSDIIVIVSPLINILLIFIGYYFYIKGKAQEAASAAIDHIEPLEKVNGKESKEKLEEAVEQVYVLVPPAARVLIPKSVVRSIVQRAFCNIEEYAKKQAKKYSSKQ